jgi:hypothetical protein
MPPTVTPTILSNWTKKATRSRRWIASHHHVVTRHRAKVHHAATAVTMAPAVRTTMAPRRRRQSKHRAASAVHPLTFSHMVITRRQLPAVAAYSIKR